MEDLNIKTIRFPVETDNKLIKMADKFGRSKINLFKQMVDYFYRTKKDPLDVNDELLKNTIIKGHQNLTGFIKTQEQTLLIPMKLDVDRMIGSQIKILDCFNKQILEHNQHSSQQQTDLIKQINQMLQAKEQLKTKFIYLLDGYIKASMTLSAKEKEELLKRTREQVKLL
ncbi:MAG TPA: BfmA/BtgA family mobilization protein [Mucilaginibacter sp.]|jgi:hypothetical protein|nr:BfmA/BtgA family mobilization protein [Mucilaginibacter sp.]